MTQQPSSSEWKLLVKITVELAMEMVRETTPDRWQRIFDLVREALFIHDTPVIDSNRVELLDYDESSAVVFTGDDLNIWPDARWTVDEHRSLFEQHGMYTTPLTTTIPSVTRNHPTSEQSISAIESGPFMFPYFDDGVSVTRSRSNDIRLIEDEYKTNIESTDAQVASHAKEFYFKKPQGSNPWRPLTMATVMQPLREGTWEPLREGTWDVNKSNETATLMVMPEKAPDKWQRIANHVPEKSLSYTSDQRHGALVRELIAVESGLMELPDYDADESVNLERKKRRQWTIYEHKLFLEGLEKYGKGDWKNISRHAVKTRTPSQVASHAQKFFDRQTQNESSFPEVAAKKRKRSRIYQSPPTQVDDPVS